MLTCHVITLRSALFSLFFPGTALLSRSRVLSAGVVRQGCSRSARTEADELHSGNVLCKMMWCDVLLLLLFVFLNVFSGIPVQSLSVSGRTSVADLCLTVSQQLCKLLPTSATVLSMVSCSFHLSFHARIKRRRTLAFLSICSKYTHTHNTHTHLLTLTLSLSQLGSAQQDVDPEDSVRSFRAALQLETAAAASAAVAHPPELLTVQGWWKSQNVSD